MASVKKVKSIKHISVDTPFEMKFGKYVSVASNFASPFKYSNKYLMTQPPITASDYRIIGYDQDGNNGIDPSGK